MLRWVVLLLLALFLLLQYRLWLGDGSWPRAESARQQLESQRAENDRLQQRNVVLEAEVLDLKTGLDAIEERARSELGLVKQGETYYQIIDEPKHE
ncbi:MAG: cell division protein FtsB [Halothiobacillaceae bacterium]|nr:MAG: cell division protein FtsB [Halothiobacillaceae bacterium]